MRVVTKHQVVAGLCEGRSQAPLIVRDGRVVLAPVHVGDSPACASRLGQLLAAHKVFSVRGTVPGCSGPATALELPLSLRARTATSPYGVSTSRGTAASLLSIPAPRGSIPAALRCRMVSLRPSGPRS